MTEMTISQSVHYSGAPSEIDQYTGRCTGSYISTMTVMVDSDRD
jgi:hypothetical protein